jgi:phosphoribosylformimino-5-aminoimidazole carboxamide ribotide isomerase
MNKIELIPAIDIIDGKCVRLQKGDYATQKVYNQNPVDVALAFEDHGVRRLHVVDLDGAASHHVVNHRVLEQIASRTGLIIDFGGGIKTDEDLIIAFNSGAEMVTLGSVAVKQPELMDRWLAKYGQEHIILGADVRDGRISTNGWKEDSPLQLLPFLQDYTAKGITKVLCTDIACDGMLQGPSIPLYKEVMAAHPQLHLIASGGVGCIQDVERLQEAGIPAVVVGKAIYEGKIPMKELERFC